VSSRRRRSSQHQQALRGSGYCIRLIELQGNLIFSTFEPVVRLALKQAPYCLYLVLNLRNVASIDPVAMRLIAQLRDSLRSQGVTLLVCYGTRFQEPLAAQGIEAQAQFSDDDAALEHCEDRLLQDIVGAHWDGVDTVSLPDTPLLAGMTAEELAWLDGLIPVVEAAPGDCLISAGDDSDRFYLLMAGSVVVRLPSETGGPGQRLNVFHAGMAFGEMGFLDGSPRSADIVASASVVARMIDRALFKRMEDERPRVAIRLLEGMSRQLSTNLRRSNAEVVAFKG